MPGFNRQGPPNGQGNQSGRKMGKCNPENKNKVDFNHDASPIMDRGGRGQHLGQGKGLGRGMGRRSS